MNLVNKVISQKYRILEKIAEGGMSIVWLACDISKGIDVAIKVLKKDVTSNRVEDIIRFKNEAFTVSKLQEQSIAKIYDVGEDDGIYYIAMEFLKGQSLFDAINRDRKFTIKESVQIIEKVCNALKCIHNAGVLHRDIKPGNLIINDENADLEVKLIDFGVSQVRDFDISDTSEIVGTLHYMSPEQSGVVNRMVDERSDLYSLGVVFYQLLAHQLPFKGETLVTLIHQHVAKIPDSLIKFNPEVPQILEKIVLKLLEKEPENRYQSANGLLADLDKFKNGQSDFIPGQQDNIIKLNYRANLIGRDEEFSKLTELFSNSLNGNGKICFIDGEAGKGKTRLTEELRNHVYAKGGLIVDAKCFPGDSKAPYGVFSDILNSFLKVYSRFENDKKAIIKQKLKKNVGELGRILLKLNPLIEEILGDCAELVPLEHDVENKRFQMVVSKFFCDLCFTHDRGFLIVIDDLHWIDEGSLTILRNMSNQIDNYPVLIIGTYRSNEINDEHILQKFIISKSSAGKSLEEIHLQDFDMDVMQRFISRLLFDNGDTIKEISSFIFQKSKGNPFFSIEILKQMVNENAVEYKNGTWQINKETINNIQIPNSIVDILVKRVLDLDEEQRMLLSYASAIGRQFDMEFLFELADMDKEKVIQIIDRSVNEQFLEKNFNNHGKILFIHDRVTEAFYKNIGLEKKQKLHNRIGRIIESRNSSNIQNVIFDLAYHFVESGDTDKALEYVYSAALKSMENFASEEAVRYFLLAAKFLEEKGGQGSKQWIECIKNAGNMNIFDGKLTEAQELFQRLLPYSKNSILEAEIYHSIGMVYFNSSQHDKAADYFKKALGILHEKIPGNNFFMVAGIIKELIVHSINRNVKYLQNKKKISSPVKQNSSLKISILDNLGWLYLSTNTLSYIYIKVKSVNVCLRELGFSRELIRSLANVGFIFGIMRSFKTAFKYFENAFTISKELKNEISYCDVNLPWGYMLQWKGNYEEGAQKLLNVVNINKKNGSYIDLITSYHAYISTLLIWGELNQVKKHIDEFLMYSKRLDGTYVKSLTAFLNSWYNILKGNIDQSLTAALESYQIASGKELLLECVECAIIARIYLIKGDIGKGFEFIERAKYINENNKFLYMYTNFLYVVWAELHLEKYTSDKENRTKEDDIVYKKRLNVVFKTSFKKTRMLPHFTGNYLCVKAKYLAIIGKYKEAEKHFQKSLEICKKYKLKFDLAVAHYEFGLFLQKNSWYDQARQNVEKSYAFFKEMSSLYYLKRTEEFLGLSGKENSDSTERFSQLVKISQRMSSLVMVSQKISSILDLDELLNKIMESVLELAGAQNAVLLMIDKKTGILEKVVSKSSGNSGSLDVQFSENIVQKVLKTGKYVVTDNAMEDERYLQMNSVVINKTKSILCIPVKYNDEIKGVCYLDNKISSSVFSEEDIEILNVFMTQVAISIENAELYRLAITDGLTELFTHKHFKSLLDREVDRCRRFNKCTSLLMCDIDNFKTFNDKYGHQAGDFVLVSVSRMLTECFRVIDVVARYGGEEFAVILPETDISGSLIAAERLRLAIKNGKFTYNNLELKVSISIGISIFPDHANDSTLLIAAADKALYKSKENGRNRITVFEPDN